MCDHHHHETHSGKVMKTRIIGAGKIGSAPAGHVCKLRRIVLIANSRAPEARSNVAAASCASPVVISGVAKAEDLLIVTIPIKAVPLHPKDPPLELPAKSPIIDIDNYYRLRDGVIAEIEGEWQRVIGPPVCRGVPSSMRSTTSRQTAFSTKDVREVRRAGLRFQYQGVTAKRRNS